MKSYSLKKIIMVMGILGTCALFATYHSLVLEKASHKINVIDPESQTMIKQIVQEINESGSTVANTLIQECAHEHAQLLTNLQQAFPLPDNQWEDTLARLERAKLADTLCIQKPIVEHDADDHALVKKARQILADYKINPKRVQIYTINEPNQRMNAVAEQGQESTGAIIHRLAINLPQLSMRTDDIQEAILRHEMMHFLNYDPLELAHIESLLERNGITQEQYLKHPAYMALSKFKELRADLSAACADTELAQAFVHNFEYNIAQHPELQDDASYWVTHPSSKQRYQAMNHLISYLTAEQEIRA